MSILHFIKKQDLEPNYKPFVNDYLIYKKNYEKSLSNGFKIVLEFWGKDKKPNVFAIYPEFNGSYKTLLKQPIEGIIFEDRKIRLEEGTSFGKRFIDMAIQSLEIRLSKIAVNK
jgi:hypothetical protein